MKYFRYFPEIDYDLDASGQKRTIVDSFRFAKIVTKFKDDITFYRFYDIPEGERPDHTSMKLYDTPNYYWTFFVANPELKSIDDWPLSNADLNDKIEHDYKGNMINISTFDFFNKFQNGETVTGLISGASAVVVGKNTSLGWVEVGTITGSIKKLKAAHHYEKDGVTVPRNTAGAAIVTNLQYEQSLNEERKRIKVIRPEAIDRVVKQFRKVIQE